MSFQTRQSAGLPMRHPRSRTLVRHHKTTPSRRSRTQTIQHDTPASWPVCCSAASFHPVVVLVSLTMPAPQFQTREVKKEITQAFGRPSQNVDYRAIPQWTARVRDVLSLLQSLVHPDNAVSLLPLIEYAYTRADRATTYVDSSGGMFTWISDEVGDLHHWAAHAARPEPKAFARKLIEFELNSELDIFHRAAWTYRDVLGTDGLREYRSIIEPMYDNALAAASTARWDQMRVTQALLGVERAEGNVDRFIEIIELDGLYASTVVEIIDVLAEAGRQEEAREWARRGVGLASDIWRASDLYSRLESLLLQHDDVEAALECRRAAFERFPVVHFYSALCDLACRVGNLTAEQSWAQQLLRERIETFRRQSLTQESQTHDPPNERQAQLDIELNRRVTDPAQFSVALSSNLVELFLHDDDIEAAWETAETYGADSDRWKRLAALREHDYPSEVLWIYEDEIESILAQSISKYYPSAIKKMKHVQQLYQRAEVPEGWSDYIAGVRSRHHLKKSLLKRMDAAGYK